MQTRQWVDNGITYVVLDYDSVIPGGVVTDKYGAQWLVLDPETTDHNSQDLVRISPLPLDGRIVHYSRLDI